MPNDRFQNKYRIESARAWWHDYSGGTYYVTICTKNREHFFGNITDGIMNLSEIGEYAAEQFRGVSSHYPDATIPLFTIMPNHIHAIVVVSDNLHSNGHPHCRDGVHTVSTTSNRWKSNAVNEFMQTISKQKGRLSISIGGIKRAVSHYANQNAIDFAWQTRFHDRIIRDNSELNRIVTYIENNVANWEDDEFYTP